MEPELICHAGNLILKYNKIHIFPFGPGYKNTGGQNMTEFKTKVEFIIDISTVK